MNCHCGEPIKAKSLCQKHYLKDYRERKAAGKIKEKQPLTFTVRPSWQKKPPLGDRPVGDWAIGVGDCLGIGCSGHGLGQVG